MRVIDRSFWPRKRFSAKIERRPANHVVDSGPVLIRGTAPVAGGRWEKPVARVSFPFKISVFPMSRWAFGPVSFAGTAAHAVRLGRKLDWNKAIAPSRSMSVALGQRPRRGGSLAASNVSLPETR